MKNCGSGSGSNCGLSNNKQFGDYLSINVNSNNEHNCCNSGSGSGNNCCCRHNSNAKGSEMGFISINLNSGQQNSIIKVEQDSGKKVEIQIMNANTPGCRSTKEFNPKFPTNNNNSCSRNNSNNDRYQSQQCQRMNLCQKIGTSRLSKIQIRPENLHFNRPAGSHTSLGGPGSNPDLKSLDDEINRIKGKYTPKNQRFKSPEFTGASP